MTGEPLLAGVVKATVAVPAPAATLVMAGAAGAPMGVTAAEAAEADEVPTPLLATTVNV